MPTNTTFNPQQMAEAEKVVRDLAKLDFPTFFYGNGGRIYTKDGNGEVGAAEVAYILGVFRGTVMRCMGIVGGGDA